MSDDTTNRGQTLNAQTVLLCLGLGCLLSTYSGAPMGSGFLSGWQEAVLLQTAFQTGIAVGCLTLGAFVRKQKSEVAPLAGAVLYAVVAVLCLFTERALARPALDSYSLFAACALTAAFGLATSLPLLFWYDRLLEVRRRAGRMRCIVLLGASEFVSIIVFMLLGLLLQGRNDVGFVAMIALAMIAAACQASFKWFAHASAPAPPVVVRPQGSYRLTRHSASMIICLGATWGLTCSMFPFIEKSGLPGMSPLVSLATGAAAFASIVILVRMIGGRQFGALVRLSVGMCGIVLAASPLLYALAPQAFYPFGQYLFILLDVSIMFFSIDICAEKGLRASEVMPTNYALFLFASCAMVAVFWLIQVFVGGQTAFELVALLGAVTVAAGILFLPSRESDAVAFTLATLPENVSFENRMAERRAGMAAKYGLLDREAEVLELLFRGMTRQQIADELHLSPWTIKDRVSAINGKTGTHSYKELTRLLEDDE